jgi:hypothetical protein
MDRAETENDEVRYRSLSRFSIDCQPPNCNKPITESAVTCHIKGLKACRFMADGMETLAHVSGSPIGHQGFDTFQWEKLLFHAEITGLGAEIQPLNLLAKKFNAPFKFKSTAPVPDANRYFHTWFQSTHNVRLGVVEGGHRCETAMRTFYGYTLGQTVPLERLQDFTPIKAYSTLCQPFSVKILQQDVKQHLITSDILKAIRKFSKESQDLRCQVVKATHKTMWWTMYNECLAFVNSKKEKMYWGPMTNETFVEHPFKKVVNNDSITGFIETIKQIVIDRYFDTEPGKSEMTDNHKADFYAEVKKERLVGRNFAAVKEVSGKRQPMVTVHIIMHTHIPFRIADACP